MPYDQQAPMAYGMDGGAGGQRDRIAQALLDVQSPPPVTPMPSMPQQQQMMPQQQQMGGTGAMPSAAYGQPGIGAGAAPQMLPGMTPTQMLTPPPQMPGQMPGQTQMPGQMPGMGMQQPTPPPQQY